MSRLHVDVGGWPTISGSSVRLVLEPGGEREDGIPRVYTFGHVGPGVPERVWHRRHLTLCSVSVAAVPERLREIVEAHIDEIVALSERYLGTEWDGHNHVGRWDLGPEDDCADALAVSREVEESCPTYWDAGDWFAGNPGGVVDTALHAGTIDAAVACEIDDAPDDVYLDGDDVRETLVSLIECEIESLDGDDVGDRLRRIRLRRLLHRHRAGRAATEVAS